MKKRKNIPVLRFPEFDDEAYLNKPLGKIAQINTSTNNLPETFTYIDLESVVKGQLVKKSVIKKGEAPSRAQRFLEPSDILFQMVRPYQQNNFYFDLTGDYVASTGYAQIRTKEDSRYLYQYLHTRKFVNEVIDKCTGTSYPAINSKDLARIHVCYPILPEQQKIATFFTAIDQKISQLKKKHQLLEQYKKGVMQQIFSQQIRFKPAPGEVEGDDDCREFPKWEKKRLGDVLFEHKTLNSKDDFQEVFSVAKQKGVVNQIEHLGRSFSAKDVSNYKVIYPNDIVYTKSPTTDFPFGIVKQNLTSRTGIVSPLYGVFHPITGNLGFLLHNYFLSWVNTYNYLNPLVQKGAKNTMNINNKDFLNGARISLPISKKEQTKIANFLSAIDDKIQHNQKQVEQAEQWKKGLMQKMFV